MWKDNIISQLQEFASANPELDVEAKLSDMMESTKVKVDQINERERREMAEAARQTIITL